MASPNVIDHPELFDKVIINGMTSPGFVRITGAKRAVDYDTKKGVGNDGAPVSFLSSPEVKFQMTFELFVDPVAGIDAFSDWVPFRAMLLESMAGAKPKALQISHPDLTPLKITNCVISSIGNLQYGGKGDATVVVEAIVYRPKRVVTTTAVLPNPPKKNDPFAAQNAEIDRLVNQWRATPYG